LERKSLEKKKSYTYPCSEILPFPLLHGRIGLEVVKVLKVKPLVLAVQLDRPFFPAGNDSIDIFVDNQTALGQKAKRQRRKKFSLIRSINDLLRAMRNHLQQFLLIRRS
jgi:hypothetical protein